MTVAASRTWAALLVLAVLGVASGCGSGDDSTTTTASSTEAAAETAH